MRISDWSSDVCSSDLQGAQLRFMGWKQRLQLRRLRRRAQRAHESWIPRMQQTVALDLEQAGVDFLENQRQTSLTGLAFQTKFAFGIDEAGQLADQCVDITDETAQ